MLVSPVKSPRPAVETVLTTADTTLSIVPATELKIAAAVDVTNAAVGVISVGNSGATVVLVVVTAAAAAAVVATAAVVAAIVVVLASVVGSSVETVVVSNAAATAVVFKMGAAVLVVVVVLLMNCACAPVGSNIEAGAYGYVGHGFVSCAPNIDSNT